MFDILRAALLGFLLAGGIAVVVFYAIEWFVNRDDHVYKD
jgi:hypothetical protein